MALDQLASPLVFVTELKRWQLSDVKLWAIYLWIRKKTKFGFHCCRGSEEICVETSSFHLNMVFLLFLCSIFKRLQGKTDLPHVSCCWKLGTAATLCKAEIQLYFELIFRKACKPSNTGQNHSREHREYLLMKMSFTTDIILDPFSILCNKKLQVILRPFEDQQTIKRVLNIFWPDNNVSVTVKQCLYQLIQRATYWESWKQIKLCWEHFAEQGTGVGCTVE